MRCIPAAARRSRPFPARSLLQAAIAVAAAMATSVSPGEAQITLDGTLGPGGPLSPADGRNYVIGSELGRIQGGNLFHSFGDFNVRTGESATFTGPTAIQNILGRVTGGNPSMIDGRLRSEIAGANLYLLNPRGIVFGPNAALEVSGAFRASTAEVLRFADGSVFPAEATTPPVLSVANPVAFGFLGSTPAPITLQGSRLSVGAGQTLSLVGGDIQMTGGRLQAPGGRVELVSVASPGSVTMGAAPTPLQLEGFDRLGSISVSGFAGVTTQGNPGGTVAVRAGALTMNQSTFNSGTTGAVDHPGLGIDVDVTGPVMLRMSEIAASSTGAGRAGDVRVSAGSLELIGDPATFTNANIGSRAFATGAGGNVQITADHIVLRDVTFINAPSLGAGAGGHVDIRAGTLELLGDRGFAFIATGAFGTGDAGNLTVAADRVLIRGGVGGFVGLATQVSTAAGGTANAGRLSLVADQITLLGGGQVSSGVFSGAGRGGDIDVVARTLDIAGTNAFGFRSGIFATLEGTRATGRGGDIRITASEVRLGDRGSSSSSLIFGSPGTAGNISVHAGTLEISGAAFIASSSLFGTGVAGHVDISADRIQITGVATSPDPFLTDFTGISTATQSGAGGTLRIAAGEISLTDKGSLSSVSTGAGRGGDIWLGAGRLLVTEGATIASSAFGSGPGGNIDVAAGEVVVAGAGQFNGPLDAGVSAIAAQAGTGGGRAGDIRIVADTLQVLDAGKVTVETFGPGDAGGITIVARQVRVAGVDAALATALGSGPDVDPDAAAAAITASTNRFFLGDGATGDAGTISIAATDVEVSAGGVVSSRTDTPGAGGTVSVVVDRLVLSGGRILTSSDVGGSGAGGDVAVIARDRISIAGTGDMAGGLFSTASGTGDAGRLVVSAPVLDIGSGGAISVATAGAGRGGSIVVNAGTATLAGGARIDSSAAGAGAAGSITVDADRLTLFGGSRIDSGTTGDGDGGAITIRAGSTTVEGAAITSNARGAGAGGNIGIAAGQVALRGGAAIAARSSGTGNAGDIAIDAGDAITVHDSVITTEAALADGGNIALRAPRLVQLADSRVTTSVQSGVGAGGNILVDPEFLVLDNSQVRADAFQGPGGNVRLVADVFLSSGSIVSASSALGLPGTVDVQAGISDVNGALASLPESALQAVALLRASCAARLAAGKASSLVMTGRAGLPPDPGGLLPNPLAGQGPSETRLTWSAGDDRLPATVALLSRAIESGSGCR